MIYKREITVLTGVEMVPVVDNFTGNAISGTGDGGKEKLKLQMIPYKSRYYATTYQSSIVEMF